MAKWTGVHTFSVSPSSAIASPHSSPNWRGTSSIVAKVTTRHGSVPVRIMDSRGKPLLIIVVEKVSRPTVTGRHHSGAIAMEMGRWVWSRGRVEGVLVGRARRVWSGVWRHIIMTFALYMVTECLYREHGTHSHR